MGLVHARNQVTAVMRKSLVSEDQRIFLKWCYKLTFILIASYFPLIAATYFLVHEFDWVAEGGGTSDLFLYVNLFFAFVLAFCMLAMAMYAAYYIRYLWKEVGTWAAVYGTVVSAGMGMFTGYCWFYLEEIRKKKRKKERKRVSKFDFVGRARHALILSTVLLAVSIGSLLLQGLNIYIPDEGEVWFETGYPEPVELDSIRLSLEDLGFEQVQAEYWDARTRDSVVIKIKPGEGHPTEPDSPRATAAPNPKESNLTDMEKLVMQALRGNGQEPELHRVDHHASTGLEVLNHPISFSELQLLFLLFMCGLPLAGIWFSCERRFMLCSAVALTHTAIIVLGFASLTQIRFDHFVLVAFVMAIIWVEVFGSHVLYRTYDDLRQSTGNYAVAINTSVNQSISRIRFFWLIIPLLMVLMFLLGDRHDVLAAFLVGSIVGGYSYTFITSSLLLLLHSRRASLS